ncbi:MAG: ATP-binding protein, partial [Clostridia bacterium]|nr:ATP-binding protein [Clostridia bacterium]
FNNFISYKNNPDQNKLRDLCLNYLQQFQRDTDFNKILILYGKAGTGKTYFALSILKMLSIIQKQPLTIKSNEKEIVLDNIYMFYSGKYVTSEDLCNDFYNSDFNTKTTRQYQIELFKTTEMLVIDEIGRGFTNPNKERNALFSIINYRINNYLPTILCTNLQERELAELFGDALLTRILQVGIKFCTDGIDNMRLVLKNRNYGA